MRYVKHRVVGRARTGAGARRWDQVERPTSIPGLRLIGTAPEKAGVLSCVLQGFRTEDVGKALNREGIAVRSGHTEACYRSAAGVVGRLCIAGRRYCE